MDRRGGERRLFLWMGEAWGLAFFMDRRGVGSMFLWIDGRGLGVFMDG